MASQRSHYGIFVLEAGRKSQNETRVARGLAQLLGHVGELNREGGHVIEVSAKIAEQLLVVETELNAGAIASITTVSSSADTMSALVHRVNAAAAVNREPWTWASAPRKVHRASWKVHRAPREMLSSIVKLTKAEAKLSRHVVSDARGRATAPQASVRATRAAVLEAQRWTRARRHRASDANHEWSSAIQVANDDS